MKAAQLWAGDLNEVSIANLQSSFLILTTGTEATAIPFHLMLKATTRICTEYLTHGQSSQSMVDKWVDSVLPFATTDDPWAPSHANFSALSLPTDESMRNQMMTEWSRSVIPDPLISMVVDATNAGLDALDSRTEKMITVLTSFLSRLHTKEQQGYEERFMHQSSGQSLIREGCPGTSQDEVVDSEILEFGYKSRPGGPLDSLDIGAQLSSNPRSSHLSELFIMGAA